VRGVRWSGRIGRVGRVVVVMLLMFGVRRHTPPQYDKPVNWETWARMAP
jgi:hypothetical protein